MQPKFSIVIPTYNRAAHIAQTIQSVLTQTTDSLEIIVVDDGSTDNTESIVRSIADDRLYYYKKENGERGAARNFGTRKSKAEYVTFLDSDDLWLPGHLDSAMELIGAKKGIKIFHLGYKIENAQGKQIKSYEYVPNGDFNRYLLRGNYMSCMGVFLENSVANAHPFSENRALSGSEDWLLWLQLAARYPIAFSTKITGLMIEHENRSVNNFNEKDLSDRINILYNALKKDTAFLKFYGKKAAETVKAHMQTYAGLHLVMSGKKMQGWWVYLKGVSNRPGELLKRRTLGLIKQTFK